MGLSDQKHLNNGLSENGNNNNVHNIHNQIAGRNFPIFAAISVLNVLNFFRPIITNILCIHSVITLDFLPNRKKHG